MKVEYIICENKAERDAVLRKLEDEGYRWGSEKPLTKWNMNDVWRDKSVVLCLKEETKRVLWAYTREYHRQNKYTVLAQNYLYNRKPILITRKGRVVTAEDKNTGDKAIATCCPTDTFDFGTGAMIAVARLIAQSDKGITKDAETVLRQLLGYNDENPADKHEAKVGDKLIIREWDEMRDNEDRDSVGNIFSRNDPQGCFSTAMKSISGKTVVITELDEEDKDRFRIVPSGFPNAKKWWVRRWMVKEFITDDSPADKEPTTKFKVGDLVTLKNDLEPGKIYGDMTLYHGDMFDSLNGKPKKVIKVCERSKNSPTYQTESEWYYSEEMLEPWDESKIREGDIVRVINTGLNYSSYPQWVGKHISDPDMAARYCYSSPYTTNKYKVIKIAEHEFNGRMLAFIEECDGIGYNRCYLIEVKGLEKVTE